VYDEEFLEFRDPHYCNNYHSSSETLLNRVRICELDNWFKTGQRKKFCEHLNEYSGFVKGRMFLNRGRTGRF
jgi:hypothetical protein